MKLILASSSPRRLDLLSRLQVPFVVHPSLVDEPPSRPDETSEQYVMRLAALKADEVATRLPDHAVLGADTVVVVDSHTLGKPVDAAHALLMLQQLRGRWHRVVTGVALRGPVERTGSVTARVHMKHAPDEQLWSYIACGESTDKAGAYALQGRGRVLVDAIEGCQETIIGLPLCLVRAFLATAGFEVPVERRCTHEPESGE